MRKDESLTSGRAGVLAGEGAVKVQVQERFQGGVGRAEAQNRWQLGSQSLKSKIFYGRVVYLSS